MHFQTIMKYLILSGILPLAKNPKGGALMNLKNWKFIAWNIIRVLALAGFLFLNMTDIMEKKGNFLMMTVFAFGLVSLIGGSASTILIAWSAGRISPSTSNGNTVLKNKFWTVLFLTLVLYNCGILLLYATFTNFDSVRNVPVFLICSGILICLSMADYFTLLVVTYGWVANVRRDLKNILELKSIELERFLQLYDEYGKLRSVLSPISIFLFSSVQIFSITSSFIAISGIFFLSRSGLQYILRGVRASSQSKLFVRLKSSLFSFSTP